MNLPGFIAEASVYDTANYYRGGPAAAGDAEDVIPQGCGFVEGIVCALVIPATVLFCTGTCVESGGLACAACVTTAMGALYSACKDCLPAWIQAILGGNGGSGGGGGGGNLCCRIGTQCKCGGTCQMVNGHMRCVGGVCLEPNQHCP